MRILVVEDEKKVYQFLKTGLESEGYSVDLATDGEEGLRMGREGHYDAIILDLMLPKKDGIVVLQEIRQSRVDAPILILSARGGVDEKVEGLNLGADDYLPKPFSFSEVLARVRAIARRKSSEEHAHVLTVADLRMDLVSRLVERAGQPRELTAKEFELLEYLVRNKNRVLSKVVLMERIWDINFDNETNVVEVAINRLRRKIDDDCSVKLIHTVRGAGYILKESPDASDEEN